MSTTLLHQESWRIIDQTNEGKDFHALQSFAMDDTLCQSVGKGDSYPVIRSWVHNPTIVLGIQDARLPFIQDGINYINSMGYQAIVRNSGGLAVVLDQGILNVSLILPDDKRIQINKGYDTMFLLIKEAFSSFDAKIEAKEIHGSYCPGSYDLSINGQKFAGISQRRIQNSMAVQIYICVENSGSERAHLIKQFYEIALKNEQTKFTYPSIQPDTMASLSELLNTHLKVNDVWQLIINSIKGFTNELHTRSLTTEEKQLFDIYFERIKERNVKSLHF